jgi:flavodoxin
MKTLIVYYSLEGNTRMIAEKLAEKTGADLLEKDH